MRNRAVITAALMAGLAIPVAASPSEPVSAVGKVGPSGRRCFTVAGSPGDAALVNLTPVEAEGAGDGQLISSDVTTPPIASNVNFGPGTVDPNVAVAPIGADGQVCYVNSVHTSVHLVADHLGTITAGSFLRATTSGAPNRTIDTRTETPPPPPPVATFSPGQYLVGSQVPAGRYEMNAGRGCYWERQSGLGGTLGEIIANDFRGFTGRVVVDIASTDLAFEFDADCGQMSTYAGSTALLSTIAPGSHVVGEHIRPGTYAATVSDGCYWERLSGFGGSLSEIIANDFVSTAGQQFVEILGSDTGFYSDADCGTWTRL